MPTGPPDGIKIYWQRVILLPSKVTADNAAQLQNELAQFAIEIQPLHVAGAEDNADACFAHFDRVIEELRNAGHKPQQILADFTRGTKAMSAALVLAAIRHELPQLRYLSGGRRDERGLVVPGTEIVTDIRTTVATARRRLDAIILAYRVLELVGQTRLCDQGIHSDDVPANHPIVQAFQAKLAKNNSNGLGRGPGGRLLASREQVARLLKDFKDPLAQRLLDLGNEGVVKASRRNYSALIHGFDAASGSDPAPLIELYDKLGKLLIADSGDSTSARLRLARTPDLSRS